MTCVISSQTGPLWYPTFTSRGSRTFLKKKKAEEKLQLFDKKHVLFPGFSWTEMSDTIFLEKTEKGVYLTKF